MATARIFAPKTTDPTAMSKAIEKAVRGPSTEGRAPLVALLCRGSNLPGPRINETLAEAFAAECASRGKETDALVAWLITLDPDAAPGGGSGPYGAGSELEFLPVCGVYAAGARAARDESCRWAMLALIHDAAEDLRFRVRDAVPLALEQIGSRGGDALAIAVVDWMDGYFHAAAVLRGMVRQDWLPQIETAAHATDLYVRAFELAMDAPRAAARYPGFKSLLEALQQTIGPLGGRFGVPMFDALAQLSRSKDPVLRDLITNGVEVAKLRSRHRDDVERVLLAFRTTAKPVRDPRSLPGPTRKRGGGRRR